ncbi:MAG: hypothetical protein VX624_12140 [Pseudomonadota bacterium]|nr:hypothetical protein [Pseudomonadota bacterium]
MPDDFSANSEYGLEKFWALFDRGLDFALDRLMRRAKAQNGNLSAADIREELARFKEQPGEDTTEFLQDAWRECIYTL